MSFEEEWAQHKAAAVDRQSVHMQLNQTPDGSYHPGRMKPGPEPSPKERIRIQTTKLLNSSWGLLELRDFVYDALDALVTELDEQRGMVGDDDAGEAFAKVYKSAASTLVDQLDFASLVMSGGAGALLDVAENFLKTEDKVAASLLKATEGPYNGVGPQPARPDCSPRPSRSGEDLPEVAGETSGVDQYLVGDRFRGDPGKLRTVAEKWYLARGVLADAFYGSRDCWHSATLDHEGVAAESVEKFFKRFVGKDLDPPDKVSEDDSLMANLPAACFMLAKACEAYAHHIESAREQAVKDRDPFFGDPQPFWESPLFGGNGQDGGLNGKVTGDHAITQLGTVAPALDSSKARVSVPTPEGGGGIPGLPGWLPPLLRAPLRVPPVLAAGWTPRDPSEPNRSPIAPPLPPDPRFPALTPGESGKFSTWLNGLREGGYAGGLGPDKAYQRRVAGYPEREVPIPPGPWDKNTLMVDGFRRTDGMAIEAKHVRDQKKCYRTLEALNGPRKKPTFLHKDDRVEMRKYAAAMKDPRNTEMRGVEVDTDYQASVPYWRLMMATYGVKGYVRHVP